MGKTLALLCAGLCGTVLGLFLGRFAAAWFPFRLTHWLYLPVKSPLLRRLLISGETCAWGRIQPKELPWRYYRVGPEDRGKLSVWGLLFYLDWFPLLALCLVTWQRGLPEALRPLMAFLLVVLAGLLLLEPLDFLLGACRALRARGIRYPRARGLVAAHLLLLVLALASAFRLGRF